MSAPTASKPGPMRFYDWCAALSAARGERRITGHVCEVLVLFGGVHALGGAGLVAAARAASEATGPYDYETDTLPGYDPRLGYWYHCEFSAGNLGPMPPGCLPSSTHMAAAARCSVTTVRRALRIAASLGLDPSKVRP